LQNNRGFLLHVLNYAWVLFLIGLALLIWVHAFGLEKKLLENAVLALEFEENVSSTTVNQVKNWLLQQPAVDQNSLQALSENDLKEYLPNDLATDSARTAALSAFPALYVFKLNPEAYAKNQFSIFENNVKAQHGVHALHFQNELTADLTKSVRRLQQVSFFITLLFVLVGILIIEYLAQAFVDSRSAIIHQWNQLGASEDRILQTYRKRTISLGLASSLFSIGLLCVILWLVTYLMPWVYDWVDTIKFFFVLFLLLILGPSLQYYLVKAKILSLIR